MKATLNLKMQKFINNGNYIERKYNESNQSLQSRMKLLDYNYSITTADNILLFVTKTNTMEILVKEFNWRMLWNKLADVPVNVNDEIETPFEHFEMGTSKEEIWNWFEWFFDITLGDEIYGLPK
jgi:hypothetical protein